MYQISRKNRFLALFSLSLGIFFAADDQTVVVTVLPEIMKDLSLNVTDIDKAAWTITGYLLGYVSIMPISGRLSDMFNRRNVYLIAITLFMIGSIGTGITNLNFEQIGYLADESVILSKFTRLTETIEWVIATRIFQAIGAGALIPISIALVGDLFSTDDRGIPYGIIGASAEAGAVLGPIWGAVIDSVWQWKAIFWLNVPIGLIIVIFVYLTVPNKTTSLKHKLDLTGATLVSVGIISITYAFSKVSNSNLMFLMWGLIGTISLLTFYFKSKNIEHSIIPLEIFKNRAFVAANLVHFLYGTSLIIVMVTIPLMANTVLSGDSLKGGLMLTRLTIAIVPSAIVGGYLSKKYELRLFCIPSLLVGAFTLFLISRWDSTISDPYMSIQLILCGTVFGILIAPITVAAIDNSQKELRGSAAGIITASRFLGMTIGIAGLSAWGAGRFQNLASGISLPIPRSGESSLDFLQRTQNFELELLSAGTELFSNFFLIAAAMCILAIFPFLFIKRKKS